MPQSLRLAVVPAPPPDAEPAPAGEYSWIPAVLDHLPIGVILIGTNGRVLHYNSTAHEILRQDDGLALYGAPLMTTGHEQVLALRTIVSRTLAVGPAEGRSSLTVARRSARPS